MVSEKMGFTCEICSKTLQSAAGLAGHKQFAHGQAKHMLAATPEAAIVELLSELADAFSRLEERSVAQAEQVKALESILAVAGQKLDGFGADLMERLAVEQAGHERAEERANRAEELAGSHPEPDLKLLEAWSRCSNCRPKLKDFCNKLHHTLYSSLGECPEVHLTGVAAEQEAKRQAEAASEAGAERSEQLKEADQVVVKNPEAAAEAESTSTEAKVETETKVDEEPELRTSPGYFRGSKWDEGKELYVEQR